MRHGKKDRHLGRTYSHREAMLSNMAGSLIMHKRIETTLSKARVLRKYVEPILTRSKEDSYQNRRVIFSYLKNKETMKELFNTVADKISNRPGGYTRIIKLGNRIGDNAERCIIELVDFNETMLAAVEEKTTRTRRSRRAGAGKKADAATSTDAPVAVAAAAANTPVVAEEATDTPQAAAEETPADSTETDENQTPKE